MAIHTHSKKSWIINIAKWGIPLLLGAGGVCSTVLFFSGVIPIHASLESLKWLIAIHNSLEGLASLIFLGCSSFSVGVLSFFAAQTFTKAWIVCPILESVVSKTSHDQQLMTQLINLLKESSRSNNDDITYSLQQVPGHINAFRIVPATTRTELRSELLNTHEHLPHLPRRNKV